MNKNIIVILLVVGVALLSIFIFTKPKENPNPVSTEIQKSTDIKFSNPSKSAHYESNSPLHGSELAAVPINVVIDFNFDLSEKSSMSITNNSKDYGLGKTTVDQNKLTMRRKMDPNAPDGLYNVTYMACWPDNTCHDGTFQFAIGPNSEGFENLMEKKKVEVSLSEIRFEPSTIKISSGTTVVWKNDDTVDHYVNTDVHPSHTYYPEQNSQLLKPGDSYSHTFTTKGFYPYHCSAHADVMNASIIVN